MSYFDGLPFYDDNDDDKPEQRKHPTAYSPQEIYAALRRHGIVGQDAACRAAAMITYHTMARRPSVSVFCGGTGSGKTAIWQALQDELGAYVGIYDASGLTAEGWKGGSISNVLLSHLRTLQKNGYSADGKLYGILVLDEADKLMEPQYGASGTNHSAIVQGQLLRLFDHASVTVSTDAAKEATILDCSRLSIVCCGAFERLLSEKTARQERPMLGIGRDISRPEKLDYSNTSITAEDLITFGMRAELVGRVDRIVQLQPLSLADMTSIVKQEVNKLGDAMHSELTIDAATVRDLAQDALDRGLGARWIRSRLAVALDGQLFEHPDAFHYKIGYTATGPG